MYPKYFATGNKNKLNEVNQILGEHLEQIEIDLMEPQGLDLEQIIKEKAEDAFKKSGMPVLVEDTALEFLAWNGLPGPLIKWFLHSLGNVGILKTLSTENDRRAVAKTAVSFFDGEKAHIFVGEVKGTISETIQGNSNFGWDPIFVPDGSEKSFAQMSSEEKNKISMRRLALESMKKSLSDF